MRNRWTGALLALAMAAFSVAMLPHLPAEVATHWDLRGEPNGWMPRGTAVFVMPGIALGVWVLLHALPAADPRRESYERFGRDYRFVANLTVLFLAAMQVVTLGHAAGWPIRVDGAMHACLGVLFVGIGNYMPRFRPNWWMGVRTPWTLSNDRVWQATHRVAGRAFVAAGFVVIASAVAPPAAGPWLMGLAVGGAALFPVAYSYFAWRRETGRAA